VPCRCLKCKASVEKLIVECGICPVLHRLQLKKVACKYNLKEKSMRYSHMRAIVITVWLLNESEESYTRKIPIPEAHQRV
jgi:hypothetical protein